MKYIETFNEDFILDLFRKSQALLNGHFKLSSGYHSNVYLQCAKVMQYPEATSLLSSIIAEKFKNEKIDVVIGPALGGIILSYEVAKKLNCRGIFAERTRKDNKKIMALRRGFEINKNEKVLITEDVITTGGSIQEILELVKKSQAETVGIACIIDRTNNKIQLHPSQFFILKINAEKHKPEDCPLCKKNIPLDSPGSKFI